MKYPWLMVLIVLTLLIGIAPAQAEIVPIDYFELEDTPVTLLDEAEIEKIVQLQQGTVQPQLISAISPDDTTVLMATFLPTGEVTIEFLNITDGSRTVLNNTPLLELVNHFRVISEPWWSSDTILSFLAINEDEQFIRIAVDHTTLDAAVAETFATLPESAYIVSASPRGTHVLLEVYQEQIFDDVPDGLARTGDITIQTRPDTINWQSSYTPDWLTLPPLMPGKIDPNTVRVNSEEVNLSIMDVRSGQIVPMTTLTPGTSVSSFSWAPDGTQVAMIRTSDINVWRGQESVAALVVRDAMGKLPPADNPFLQGNVLEVFDIASGEARIAQTYARDGNGDEFVDMAWSPDGQMLMVHMARPGVIQGRTYPTYIYAESGYFRLYTNNLEQIGSIEAPELQSIISEAQFVSESEVLFTTLLGMTQRIYYHHMGSGEFRQISEHDGMYLQLHATSNKAQQVIFFHSSFYEPGEIFRLNWDSSGWAALTYYNTPLQELNQIQVHEMAFPLANGAVRYAQLIQPAGAPFPPQNEPMVLWQQGGPGGPMLSQWTAFVEAPFNLLPNFGISVLVLPLQGRPGWGPALYNELADNRNFGQVDIDEAADVVRQMIANGYTSSDRIGISGCSYGGYFTSQSIVRHPDLYAAANTQCSLLDLITEWNVGFSWFIGYLMGSTPTLETDEYLQDSPGFLAANIRTPLLIFHGSDDFLPVSTAENFHEDVAATGTPVRMLRFMGAGHGITDFPEYELVAAQEQIVWFRRYLAGLGGQNAPEGPQAAPPAMQAPVNDPEDVLGRMNGLSRSVSDLFQSFQQNR
ncbi:MAG: prolyl oligopeptidase family serine peptidase [Chloroflexaceae bacterium]|nr:prolyl oligopeptidase family serine peptidase [Chloroflexaceae bacterium]